MRFVEVALIKNQKRLFTDPIFDPRPSTDDFASDQHQISHTPNSKYDRVQKTRLISTHSNTTTKASAATPTRRWLFSCLGPCTKCICDSCTAQNRLFDKVINNRLSISGTIFGANNPSFKDALDKDRWHDIQWCWRLLVDAALDAYHGGRSGHPRHQCRCRCFFVSAQCPTRK